MTKITIPNRPLPGETRDINALLADFDAITTVVNGKLDGATNIEKEGIEEKNYKKESISQEKLTAAVQGKIGAKVSGLVLESKNESLVGVNGILYEMTKEGSTLTLPFPTKDLTIGAICAPAVNSIKVNVVEGLPIYGDFITGINTITLTKNQHVIFHGSGGAWYIESGEPKREQKYSALVERVNETEYEPSATRPTFVSLKCEREAGTVQNLQVFCGGIEIAGVRNEAGTGAVVCAYSFICPPGQKWRTIFTVTNGGKLYSSYLTL